MVLLSAAEDNQGEITFSRVKGSNGFTKERFDRAIERLLQDGLAWEDEQNPGEVAYWFPAYMRSLDESLRDINLF